MGLMSSLTSRQHSLALERIVEIVQQLSLARDTGRIAEIVRHEAHELTGADGASFVLREGDLCYYADEEAISHLWKGQRFPMDCCVSGWSMKHRQPVAIPDIYADSRIPAEAYRPTFVKSLLMVPIRPSAAMGAIGVYWAHEHTPADEEIRLLQALANSTAVAMENVQLYASLETRVQERTDALEREIAERKRLEEELRRHNAQLDEAVRAQTAELRAANATLERSNLELQQFAYVAAHDLQTPLRAIVGFAQLLQKKYQDRFDGEAEVWLAELGKAARRMHTLIADLLDYSRVDSRGGRFVLISMQQVFNDVRSTLDGPIQATGAHVAGHDLPEVIGDPTQLAQVLQNLIENALKYRSEALPRIEVSAALHQGEWVFAVRDNGIGVARKHWRSIFDIFRRLHTQKEFPGTGIGLAICRRVIHRHGGRIWVESEPGSGSSFYFTLPARSEVSMA